MVDDENGQHYWKGIDKLIGRWLADRQSLIVQYCGLSGIHKDAPRLTPIRHAHLAAFCQTLVDYLSAGHFQVYCQLLQEAEREGAAVGGPAGVELAPEILPRIARSTEQLLAFHDQYAEPTEELDPARLALGLSRLGEALAMRLELEDALLAPLYQARSEAVSE